MEDFVSGQKVSAEKLNQLKGLVMGSQNPTDRQFVKTDNGDVDWGAAASRLQRVNNRKVFDAQVRYHWIDVTGENESDVQKFPVPFWYVYLGSDSERQNFEDLWDLGIESASNTLWYPHRIISLLLPDPAGNQRYDDYEYRDSICQMTMSENGEFVNAYPFDAMKTMNAPGQGQLVGSDGNGWYCTGIPAQAFFEQQSGKFEYPWGYGLYATYAYGTSNEYEQPEHLTTVLIFSNHPIKSISQLYRNVGGKLVPIITLPNGENIFISSLMGEGSVGIATYSWNRSKNLSTVTNTGYVPSYEREKNGSLWTIEKSMAEWMQQDDIEKASKQMNLYFVTNTDWMDYDGFVGWNTFVSNPEGHDTEFKYGMSIFFNDIEQKPTKQAALYYIAFVYPKGKEGEEVPEPYLKTFLAYEYDSIDSALMNKMGITYLARYDLQRRIAYEEVPLHCDVKAVLAYIVNVNDSTPDMNKWSIEYAITLDVPNFHTSPYYDADVSNRMKTTMCSLQRKTYGDSATLQDNNDNKYYTPIDQLYRFDEWDYSKHPKSPAIEPDIPDQNNKIQMVQRHIWKDGDVVNAAIEYKDIEDFMGVQGDAEPIEKESNTQKSIDKLKNLEDGTKVIQLYDFENPEITTVHTNIEKNKETYNLLYDTSDAVLVRDGATKTLKYKKLTLETNLAGAEIKVDSEVSGQTYSLEKLSKYQDQWYQLYQFDKMNTDINAKIWTIGDLDSDKRGKVGKLIDYNTHDLLDIDVLVRDRKDKKLKYMQFTVDSIKVDTYISSAKSSSIMYGKEIVGGSYTDQNYLTLTNFRTMPSTKLTGTINGNGTIDITGDNVWILTKKYNPSSQEMELKYDKLQLVVDLPNDTGELKTDTDATPSQKSIEKKQTSDKKNYIQLYNFTSPTITTKKTTLDSNTKTYDLLDSNDSVLVRSGSVLTYKKLQIETKLPGGQTSGYTGSVDNVTRIYWDASDFKIKAVGVTMSYENGLLKTVSEEKNLGTVDTVGFALSQE